MDAIRNTLAENMGGIAQNIGTTKFTLEEVPDLTGKVAIVTGGSEGIGYGCTHTLLSHNVSKLFILSRTQETVDNALAAIEKELGAETARKVHFIYCDLSDWKNVSDVTEKITKATDRLDILVMNAARGIMTYQLTDQNIDLHIAQNHIGHVILTSHLLPLLQQTAEKGNTVRLVTLGSNVHKSTPSDTKFASIDELNRDLGPNAQYGRSKLAVMLYARYLAKHLTAKQPKILSNTVHPGFVSTRQSTEHIHEAFPLAGYAMSVGVEPFKKDQFDGCVSAMYAATTTEKSGQFICPPATVEEGSSMYQDDTLMEQLMTLTKQIIMEKMYKETVQQGCPLHFY